MYYASFGMLAVILHIIINIDVFKKRAEGESIVRVKYRRFLWSLLIYYIVDILWGTFYGFRLIFLAYIDTFLFFLTMVITLFLWMRFIVTYLDRDGLAGKILSGASIFILGFEVIALIVNIFYPIVFHFNEAKEYVPGHARYFTLAVQILMFALTTLYTMVSAVKESGKVRRHFLAVGVSGFVMTLFIVLQTLYELLPLYAIGCLIATCVIHSFVVADERDEQNRELGSARQKAYKDALTRVQNATAYHEMKDEINDLIVKGEAGSFGIIVMDINNLKKVNDTLGHDAGDRYIQAASALMCNCYVHSPVYRIGGDEFVVIIRGQDYENRDELIEAFEKENVMNHLKGFVVVSSGLGIYNPETDATFDEVFERADKKMYERKKELKEA